MKNRGGKNIRQQKLQDRSETKEAPRTRERRASLPAPASRLQITDFELIRKIGQGGFGEVYLSRKKDTNEILALKIMAKDLIWTCNKKQQVKNERDVLAQGAHDHLVRLHYSFQDPHYLYLAMEYCPGGDLFHLVESFDRLEEDEARLYMAEMVVAINSLHNLGYIHRDLKPDNFLIDAKGHIKLADFGLSKEGLSHFAGESPALNKFSTVIQHGKGTGSRAHRGVYSVVGSPAYMAPEVLQMSSEGYGKEVDWWSLGCLIFEMVVGYPPFNGNSPQEVFGNVSCWKTLLPKIITDHRTLFSDEFVDLLLGLLCEPDKRLGSDLRVIQEHPFFKVIHWENLRDMIPLFVPKLENDCDISYFMRPTHDNTSLPSPVVSTPHNSFSRYYHTCLLKRKEKLFNPLEVQLERLHRSHSLDTSELHAHNVPVWVTPFKRACKRGDSTSDGRLLGTASPRTKPSFMSTPPKEGSETPDKQILGFTFQRKQTSRVVQLDRQQLPVFKLSGVDELFLEDT